MNSFQKDTIIELYENIIGIKPLKVTEFSKAGNFYFTTWEDYRIEYKEENCNTLYPLYKGVTIAGVKTLDDALFEITQHKLKRFINLKTR